MTSYRWGLNKKKLLSVDCNDWHEERQTPPSNSYKTLFHINKQKQIHNFHMRNIVGIEPCAMDTDFFLNPFLLFQWKPLECHQHTSPFKGLCFEDAI